jgi:hypothetical protein
MEDKLEDNRLPKIIREFANKPAEQTVLSFLSFEDWLSRQECEGDGMGVRERVEAT